MTRGVSSQSRHGAGENLFAILSGAGKIVGLA
jgi:hypothetical protein